MDINQLQETYNIDMEEIVSVLKNQNITMHLSHWSDVPEDWIPLIEAHLQIDSEINIEINADEKTEERKFQDESEIFPTLSSNNNFYAYIKFVGPENDHAFVQKITSINNIDSRELNSKSPNDYKLMEDCTSLRKGQIILCTQKSRSYQIAKIQATVFCGNLAYGYTPSFTDWTSFKNPEIIKNVKFRKFENKEIIVTTKLSWNGYELICLNVHKEVNKDLIFPKVDRLFKKYIISPRIEANEITTIYKELLSEEDYFYKLRQRFNFELEDDSLFITNEKIINFFKKWELLAPSLVTYTNIKKEQYFQEFFKLWINEMLNLDFWEENIIDACIQYQQSLGNNDNTEEKGALGYILTIDHLNKIESTLPNYFNHNLIIPSLTISEILKNIIGLCNIPNKEIYYKRVNDSLSDDLKFELWLEGKIESFSIEMAKVKFSELEVEKQGKVIQILDEIELSKVLMDVKSPINESHYNKLFQAIKIRFLETLRLVSFDIESDIHTIKELAWNTNDDWNYYNTTDRISDGLKGFKEAAENKDNILIGHNIIDFDCPILEKRGVVFSQEQLWDTFRVEAILSPELKHYALVTKHNAEYDAKLTLELFTNQVLRIINLTTDGQSNLFNYLSKNIVDTLESLKRDNSFPWINEEFLLKHRQTFYRPQPKIHPHISESLEFVSNSTAKLKLILGPKSFKSEIIGLKNIQIINTDDELDYRIIDKRSIRENKYLSFWLKSVLLGFLFHCDSNNKKPYWGNLAIVIKLQLENHEIDVFTLLEPIEESSFKTRKVFYLTVEEMSAHWEILREFKNIDVAIIQPQLITVTQKNILKEINIEDYGYNIKDNNFWLKFSGGQSYVSLTKQECENFEIEIPSEYTNFWIEKYQIGKYRIWANSNWESILEALPIGNKKLLSVKEKEFVKDQTIFIRANFSTTKSDKILRFNPESIYRSRYWVFQKELVNKIVFSERASVLLIQRYSEIAVLENYFRALGYYIPKREATLARRLELLHSSNTVSKLIIETIEDIGKVINSNYSDELNVIIDSFNLAENFYISQNSELLKEYSKKVLITKSDIGEEIVDESEDEEEENLDIPSAKKPPVKDTFLLLSLHLPQINYYRSLIKSSNQNHKLWILDSRIDDFPELSKIWNSETNTFSMELESEHYEKELKLADHHIPSVKPKEDIPFNTEEIKKILSNVFLDEGNSWRDNQISYLDLIIPGKTDELVTLPTGGGKSLLFQAPALFKSSFTNKLTIVVTPLKALMVDQVYTLWEKGFYGSVEYLNSDRGSDVQIIYKALAGGELALLFVTPERFRSRAFINALNVRIQSDGGLEYFVFDEAHCVSQWGHEFRPDYFNCAKIISRLKKESLNNTPLLLFSATVSLKIYEDFKKIFS